MNTPDRGVVGIPFFDDYVEKATMDYLDRNRNSTQPFFMSVNFMKVHQPNLPAPEFQGKSMSKSKYANSVVENDTRIGRIMEKIRSLGLDKNTYVFWTTDNGAWQDVYPDAGYTPFRGTKGTVREGGNRVPSIAWGPGIKAGARNSGIVCGLDYMATFAKLAGVNLPEQDREGQPIIFDSYDLSPILFGTGKSARKSWFYFTENELTPGAARIGHYKAVFNLRGDDGTKTGGLAVDSNLGWKGPESYVATVPQVFDMWQDPQERYDVFMNNYTEHTWYLVTINAAVKELMQTYVKVPPRKLQSEGFGPDHADAVSALPEHSGSTPEGRVQHWPALWQLADERSRIPIRGPPANCSCCGHGIRNWQDSRPRMPLELFSRGRVSSLRSHGCTDCHSVVRPPDGSPGHTEGGQMFAPRRPTACPAPTGRDTCGYPS